MAGMMLKTYSAASMSEALHAVHAELGPDAVILSTRSVRRGGLLGLFARPKVEITAAGMEEDAGEAAADATPRTGASPGEDLGFGSEGDDAFGDETYADDDARATPRGEVGGWDGGGRRPNAAQGAGGRFDAAFGGERASDPRRGAISPALRAYINAGAGRSGGGLSSDAPDFQAAENTDRVLSSASGGCGGRGALDAAGVNEAATVEAARRAARAALAAMDSQDAEARPAIAPRTYSGSSSPSCSPWTSVSASTPGSRERSTVVPTAHVTSAEAAGESSASSDEPMAHDELRRELAAIRAMMGRVLEASAARAAGAAELARGEIAGAGAGDRSGAGGQGGEGDRQEHFGGSAAQISFAGPPAARAGLSRALTRVYAALIEEEVAKDIADEILAAVRRTLAPDKHDDEAGVREAFAGVIEGVLRSAMGIDAEPESTDPREDALAALLIRGGFREPGEVRRANPRARGSGESSAAARPANAARDAEPTRGNVVVFVGPTGVGKTTTIAKLAASYRLRHGLRVALVTCDTYRIAAVDQLRTYAEIIGVPLRVVKTPEQMRRVCAALCGAGTDVGDGDGDGGVGYDAVLVDTPGRNPADARRLGELRAMIEAARPAAIHLVVSAAASSSATSAAIRRFGALAWSDSRAGFDSDGAHSAADRRSGGGEVEPGGQCGQGGEESKDLGRVRAQRGLIVTKLDEAGHAGVVLNLVRRTGLGVTFCTTGQEVPDDIERARPDRLAHLIVGGLAPRDAAIAAARDAARGVRDAVRADGDPTRAHREKQAGSSDSVREQHAASVARAGSGAGAGGPGGEGGAG